VIVHVRRTEEVKLDPDAIEEVFRARLDQMCGGEHVYIDDKTGKVMSWEDTGHGSGLTEAVEHPTARQIAALKFRSTLKEIERLARLNAEEKLRKDMRRGRRAS